MYTRTRPASPPGELLGEIVNVHLQGAVARDELLHFALDGGDACEQRWVGTGQHNTAQRGAGRRTFEAVLRGEDVPAGARVG